MRLASYNVENLFDRAKAMNLDDPDDGKPILEAFAELNNLLAKLAYAPADKTRMSELMVILGLDKSDIGPFVILRRNRGSLLKRPPGGAVQITADGRAAWVGSLELRDEPLRHDAVLNTARVIADVDADVLAVVEAESRPVLVEFNHAMITEVGGAPYRHVMLIDGNDDRGIDVGLMTRDSFEIASMCSHVDDRLPGGAPIFSRDCPQYEIVTPAGNRLILLINHLKSKGFGSPASSNAKRLAQAKRVREIYDALRAGGHQHIAIVGDFNDTPTSAPLAPLLQGSDLQDVSALPAAQFDNAGFPGTFGSATAANKIDYILLSPALFALAIRGGIDRKGMWPGTHPKKWDVFPELGKPEQAASDHGAIWVDLNF